MERPLRIIKKELRRKMREVLAKIEPVLFVQRGKALAQRMREVPQWQTSSSVLVFLSLPGEIDTTPLVDAALQEQKQVYVPRVEGDHLRFYRIFTLEGPWEQGPFGIREPFPQGKPWQPQGLVQGTWASHVSGKTSGEKSDAPFPKKNREQPQVFGEDCAVPSQEETWEHRQALIIVPGLAFDKEGHRLGRGKGYYDRFLHQYGAFLFSVGVGLTEQLVPSVPVDEQDVLLDLVLTV
ncbi:MAG: 5-formyltetrahydrofolate cyclo-ligase [Treponemataceae bacterium]|nr:5-formyltetrahydrofolate cyclo-ligase [Treponemataceae bacterium]